jgi:cellulose synthase/poly-beta-1,6-N-acetylglucosamine synthase-like glycosyltransferase
MGKGKRVASGRIAAAVESRAHLAGRAETKKHGGEQGRHLPPPAVEIGTAAGSTSGLPDDVAFLADFGVAQDQLARAADIAAGKGMAASEVLFARGWLSRELYGEMLALEAGVAHARACPGEASPTMRLRPARSMITSEPLLVVADGEVKLALAASPGEVSNLLAAAKGDRRLLDRAILVPPAMLRKKHLDVCREAQSARAARALASGFPEYSAFGRVSRWQLAAIVVAGMVFTCVWLAEPLAASIIAGALMTAFYLASVLLRAVLIWQLDDVRQADWRLYRPAAAAPEDLPRYSIFVALYREAGQVQALVRALDALDWPKDRREVFLVCEEDDLETQEAIRLLQLPPGFHLVVCPDCRPRTKPKALNYALPLATGEFTVIYDAEDRPHRHQLREAHERFSQDGPQLACLQAPLAIHNWRDNWLTAMFAIEYETLFRGMLPALEGLGAPFPLGGTSNHFRTSILRKAGEWDPWNVTEDADLGVRLARLGHRCGTLVLPTMEEAPTHLGGWLRQRTRWLKGWIQTIFVHTRNPAALLRDLGWRKTMLFHLVLSAIVLSALSHPVFLAALIAKLWRNAAGNPPDAAQSAMLAVAVFNLAAGYTTYGFLAHEIARRNGRRILPLLCTLPLYWLLISAAGWRAAWQFVFDPFHWEKTEHGLAKSATGAIMEGDV